MRRKDFAIPDPHGARHLLYDLVHRAFRRSALRRAIAAGERGLCRGNGPRRTRRAKAVGQSRLDNRHLGDCFWPPYPSCKAVWLSNGADSSIDRFASYRYSDEPSHERVAQLVEHLTFNQRVMGSNPIALTNVLNHLDYECLERWCKIRPNKDVAKSDVRLSFSDA